MVTKMDNEQSKENEEGNSKENAETVHYVPPPKFKLIEAPPVIKCPPPENTEIWLVRIQDGGLRPSDLKGKQIKMKLKSSAETLGFFHDSTGVEFEIINLHNATGAQPYAFFPKENSGSLKAQRISRQVAIAQYVDPVALDYSNANHSISEGYPSSSEQHSSPTGHFVEDTPSHQRCPLIMDMTAEGISALDSLNENKERFSTEKARNSSKKSKHSKLSQSEPPHTSAVSSEKKKRKHKKVKVQDVLSWKQHWKAKSKDTQKKHKKAKHEDTRKQHRKAKSKDTRKKHKKAKSEAS